METAVSLHRNQRGPVSTFSSGSERTWWLICIVLVVLGWSHAEAKSPLPDKVSVRGAQFAVERISSGHGVLWGMAFLPDSDQMLLAEKSGKLVRLNLKTRAKTPVTGLPKVDVHGQGGLMDLRLHPNFKDNALIYWTYSVKTGGGHTTRLARGEYRDDELKNVEVLFTGSPSYKERQHFGSRIDLHGGYVFFTIGDRGHRHDAQKLSTHNGKVLRLHEDGRTPADNPFVNEKDALGEIWSYGHRNPQGLYRHPETGELWLHEHGPRGGDEINLVLKGRNYGWPLATFGREYYGPRIGVEPPVKGMESPRKHYTPSIAPSGLVIVPSSDSTVLKGAFVLGSLVLTHLNLVWPQEDGGFSEEVRLFESAKERLRNVDYHGGSLYFSSDSGNLYRMTAL